MLEKDITDKRKERHQKTQEDFTPVEICHILFEGQDELFKNFKKTFCDPCCGTGNIIRYLVHERLKHCSTKKDVYNALSSIYGTELMQDNTLECRQKILYDCLEWSSEHDIDLKDKKIMKILKNNIVCTDTFKWDYENWISLEPKNEQKQLEIFRKFIFK